MPAKYTPEQRIATFWSRVDKSGGEDACWLWTAGRDDGGYGLMKWDNRATKAHRIAYSLAYGDFPNELKVLHSCDTPACCNSKHLILGTQSQNVADMDKKGRRGNFAGEHAPRRKLDWVKVNDLRRKAQQGKPSCELAEQFNISQKHVQSIVAGRTWKIVE